MRTEDSVQARRGLFRPRRAMLCTKKPNQVPEASSDKKRSRDGDDGRRGRAMAKLKAYSGGCHCGRVRYETTTDPSQAIACNCSICARHGLWLTFVSPQQFKLVSGLDDLTDYQFNKHIVHHVFCRNCGA